MRKQKREPDVRYIQCGDHKKRRWQIVCIHLCEGISHEWVEMATGTDLPDYLCPSCAANNERILRKHDLKDLRPVCVMCVERIRVKLDPKYQSLS